jgi:hypothetical protein
MVLLLELAFEDRDRVGEAEISLLDIVHAC